MLIDWLTDWLIVFPFGIHFITLYVCYICISLHYYVYISYVNFF